jgi:hypothetical protein
MTMVRGGGCLCGKVRYEVTGPAKSAIQCYCRDCQHISGGGHLPAFIVHRDNFSRAGPVKLFYSTSDAGSDLVLGFCSECGSPIFRTTSKAPDLVFIAAGSLDDPASFEPGRKVFEGSRHPWDKS